MNWRVIRSEAKAARDLPEVDAERCVHARVEVASCRRCVAACPTSAWSLDDEQLAIDSALCDGCGVCVASCPEGALSHKLEPELRRWGGQTTAFASCENTDTDAPGASVPCVHAFGLAQLARLYGAGVRRILISIGDCEQCPRGAGERLSNRLSELNRVLARRGLPTVVARTMTAAQWRSIFPGTKTTSTAPGLSRRGFLRSVLAAAADKDLPGAPWTWRAPGASLPLATGPRVAFYAPEIDIDGCNGCDACVRACSHGVLDLAPGADAYVIDADACTGCALCADVCDQSAVALNACVIVKQSQVPLEKGRCTSCGADFHRPRKDKTGKNLCHVCIRTDHRGNLFQVL